MTDRYNPAMETLQVAKDRVFYHKKLNKMLVLECGHPEDGALYLMREYDMFNNDFLNEPHCIIYYAVEKTDLWPTFYTYNEVLLEKVLES
jgi:hypothetical protein